jgi:hypothetical protein
MNCPGTTDKKLRIAGTFHHAPALSPVKTVIHEKRRTIDAGVSGWIETGL